MYPLMDRGILLTLFLLVATIIAYADELAALVRALWREIGVRRGRRAHAASPGFAQVVFVAATDLASSNAERIARGIEVLRAETGPEALAHLIALLDHPDADVARRAATLLYERQDPRAMEPLYRYLAQNP
jgi:hypothetical protein